MCTNGTDHGEIHHDDAPIDVHVHIVGCGAGGTGCELVLKGFNRVLSRFMFANFGLPASALHGELDRLYVDRLLMFVRTSSLRNIVILANDRTYDDNARPTDFGSLYVPNRYVLDLAAAHPEFLAGVSIHPARPDALDELDYCAERGATLLKLLPNCHNVDCNDEKYRPFWERVAAHRLPFLAHTGGELTLPIYNKKFQDPRVLRLPLECGVTVIAAHAATSNHPFDTNYFPELLSLFERFPNLYADISALNTPLRSAHLKACLDPAVLPRLVHGSDLPVPVSARWARLRGLISAKDYERLRKERNVIELDYRAKLAMGFPPEVFSRFRKLMPRRSGS